MDYHGGQDRDKYIAALYDAQYKRLYRIAFRMIGRSDVAEEIVQETFILALSKWETLKEHPAPEKWLVVTLSNLVKNEKRLQVFKDMSIEELFHIPAAEAEQGIGEILPRQLAKEDKEVLIWRYELKLDYQEIADRLGISESGSRSRVFRAVERCRKLLADEK